MAETEKPKMEFGCGLYVLIVGGLFALFFIYLLSQEQSTGRRSATSPCTWENVATFMGQGIKNTDSFMVTGSKWKIKWYFDATQYLKENGGPGVTFQVFAVDRAGVPELAANVLNKVSSSDEVVLYGSGIHHLEISTTIIDYAITVQECK